MPRKASKKTTSKISKKSSPKTPKKSSSLLQDSFIFLKRNYSQISPSISKSLKKIKNTIPTTVITKPKDLFTTKCEIPVFIVPSGSTPNDYKIYADFYIYEAKSHGSYKIPIPQIQLYSAYTFDKFDFNMFQDTFILTFTDYFHSSMKNIFKDHENARKIEKIKLEETKKEESTFLGKFLIVVGAVGAMAIAVNPLFDLLFLLVALSGGYEATKELFQTIKNDISSQFKGSNVDVAFKKDKREIKAKEVLIRKALSDIKPIIHPGLKALQTFINDDKHEVDNSIKNKIYDIKPSLLPILHNNKFLSSFPLEIKRKINKNLLLR